MNAESGTALPRYDVAALNGAIGALLERGFPPRFLLEATVSRPQLKKGHLWLTLLDQTSSIAGVVWASQLSRLTYQPEDGDGVTVVGKLNFWTTRASLCVQILDLRPSLSSVLRRFERTREQLAPLGLFLPERKRPLPRLPGVIALLTSAPSSALADMLRTAAERWPACRLIVVPIPVQGAVEERIRAAVEAISRRADGLGVEAVVLARGGGSREDLAVFDAEAVALALAHCPVPVVTGLGHEDDTTIADLVADYRAATPTAAIVALLPDRHGVLQGLTHHKALLAQQLQWRLQRERQRLEALRLRLEASHPNRRLTRQRERMAQLAQLLEALSPRQMLRRGFSVVRSADGRLVRSALQLNPGERIQLEFADGLVTSRVIERLNRAESGSVITGSDSPPTIR